MNNLGTDAAVLDALIAKRNADRAREEEVAASAAEAAAREQDQKRIDARHRDERRRAKARKRAWERQLRKAEEQHQALNDEAAYLAQRIIALEGRNRVIRMFLPRNSELERLRARARQCRLEIAQADAGIAKLRSSPPEGPDLADFERSFHCPPDCPLLSPRHLRPAGFPSPRPDLWLSKGRLPLCLDGLSRKDP